MTQEAKVIDWPTAPPNPVPKPEVPLEGQAIPTDQLIPLYANTVRWQHQELLRKNYEINKLKERVCAYHDELTKTRDGTPRSAYEVLLLLANDPTEPANVRLRAAEAIVQFERPKLSATMSNNINHNVAEIGTRLDSARRRIAAHKPIWPVEVPSAAESAAPFES